MTAETFDHDTTVKKLRTLSASTALRDRVTELFIASIATGVRRAMTSIMAYYSARNLPDHTWERFNFSAHGQYYHSEMETPCEICGITHSFVESESGFYANRKNILADFALCGRCSMVPNYSHLFDLEDVKNITLEYRPEYVEVLRALLQVIESVSVSASTTELQKQVSAAKVMPKSNRAARLWCLRILAELGVITNASVSGYSGAFHFYSFLQRFEMEKVAFAKMHERADPVWPLSAGRGQPPVDWSLAYRLFPQLSS
jgi:hypothetical protein